MDWFRFVCVGVGGNLNGVMFDVLGGKRTLYIMAPHHHVQRLQILYYISHILLVTRLVL